MTRETVAILDRIKPSTLFREIFEHGGRTIHGAELEIEAAGSPAPRTLLHLLNDELSTDESEVTGDDGWSVDPSCVNASNPYHRCTVHCSARASKTIRRSWGAKLVQKGESRTTKSRADERRNVDPMCVNASNPYHKCTEYCAQRNPEAKRIISRVRQKEKHLEESEAVRMRRKNVDPMCANASNPYHRCTQYCSQRTPEARVQTQGGKSVRQKEKHLEESEAVRMRRRNVDPMCVNASNPYHRCTQYCSQRTPEARVQTQGGKSDINGEGSSEGRSSVSGRHVDPMCPNASNPYHRCTEYCSKRTPEARIRAGKDKSQGKVEHIRCRSKEGLINAL